MINQEIVTTFAPINREQLPIQLDMQKLWLVGRIQSVGARLLVKHVFRSAEKRPTEVIYSFGLPRDAALRRFKITGKDFSVTSDLKPIKEVRRTYEDAIEHGHLAGMATQYADGIVNLTVGNIRPGEEVTVNLEIIAGVEVRDNGIRFRFPFTLAPSYHTEAKAAEIQPGVGEIELPFDEFGDLILPQFVENPNVLHEVGFDLAVHTGQPIIETASPSHSLKVAEQENGHIRVSLATAKDVPNRDLVLDIRTKENEHRIHSGIVENGNGYFAAVIPSSTFAEEKLDTETKLPRSVMFVLDRSGSMHGAPFMQACKAIQACMGLLTDKDRFNIIAFDDSIEIFDRGLVNATSENRARSRMFLESIYPRGGTQLEHAVIHASEMLKHEEESTLRDVIVVTDGQVFGTESIIGAAIESGIRIHPFGIGSASQDRFLTMLARQTRGTSRFLTPRERIDTAAIEFFASISRELASSISAKIEGFDTVTEINPKPTEFAFAGNPLVIFGKTSGQGKGNLVLEWNDTNGNRQSKSFPLQIQQPWDGESIRLIQGARLISDLESTMGERFGYDTNKSVEKQLAKLSKEYGLASRVMGLVAVVKREGDKEGDIPLTKVVPVGMAEDVYMDAYFSDHGIKLRLLASEYPKLSKREFRRSKLSIRDTMREKPSDSFLCPSVEESLDMDDIEPIAKSDVSYEPFYHDIDLVDLAASIEPDGGMPGKTEEKRVLATIRAILIYLNEGHGMSSGTFRMHVRRMVEFLEKSSIQNEIVAEIIGRAKLETPLDGDWVDLKPNKSLWKHLKEALEH